MDTDHGRRHSSIKRLPKLGRTLEQDASMHDYEQLGIIAYSLINGAILLSFVTALGLCGYAWWRLLKWALRRQS